LLVFRPDFALEDDIGSHDCSLEAIMRVTNGDPLGWVTLLPVGTVNSVQTLKANNDGLIDLQEFTAAMSKQGISNKKDIKAYFEAINQDGTGKIKYSEFVAAELDQSTTLTDGQIEAAFHRMDFDGSGSISAQEVYDARF
jgi:hypothetical protein